MKIEILLAFLLGLLIIFMSSCLPGTYYPDNQGSYQPQVYRSQPTPQVQAPRERCDCRQRCQYVPMANPDYYRSGTGHSAMPYKNVRQCNYSCLNQYGAECR